MLSGTWTTLSNPAPSNTGTMMLLSDGSAMVQEGGTTNTWYRLTRNPFGGFASGTWTTLSPMSTSRLYYASNVLKDGRVFLVGGEYSSARSETNTGEIYNPVANTWTAIAPFPEAEFGDDPSQLLPDGRVITGYINGPQTFIYDPTSNSWSSGPTKLYNDPSSEESWVKLPDNSILSYDVQGTNSQAAQRYVPSLNQWVSAGTVPVQLGSNGGMAIVPELGPALRLPDGRVFFIGASGHTAFYTPPTTLTGTGSWTAGPDIPNGLAAFDAPAAMMFNGKVLMAVGTDFNAGTTLFEFDPTTNTYTNVTPAGLNLNNVMPFNTRMLDLPSGQVLFTNGTNQLALYLPDGSPNPSWKPAISSVTANGNGTFTLTGTQLNGISEGAAYGDDAEMDSNYPIIRLVNASNYIFYARTSNWSSTGVATGSTLVSTSFTLPAGLPQGTYSLSVITNGIGSDPIIFSNEPIADPGFEQPYVGVGTYYAFQYRPSGSPWTFAGAAGLAGNGSGFTSGNPAAPQGTQVAFLQTYGSVSQTISLVSGSYTLSFLAAQRGNYQASYQTFQVLVDGGLVGTIKPAATNYASYSTSFTVAAGTHTLAFVGVDPNGGDNTAFLDQLQISTASSPPPPPPPPPGIKDPGFETPYVGVNTWSAFQYDPSGSPWVFAGLAGVAGNGSGFTLGNPPAPQGTQVAFLQGTGRANEAVSMSGGSHTIRFMAAERGNIQASYQTFQVLVDGSLVATVRPAGTSYTSTTASFVVTAGVHVLTFAGLDPNGGDNTAFVDQVQINVVASPSSSVGSGSAVSRVSPLPPVAFQPQPSGLNWTLTVGVLPMFPDGGSSSPEQDIPSDALGVRMSTSQATPS